MDTPRCDTASQYPTTSPVSEIAANPVLQEEHSTQWPTWDTGTRCSVPQAGQLPMVTTFSEEAVGSELLDTAIRRTGGGSSSRRPRRVCWRVPGTWTRCLQLGQLNRCSTLFSGASNTNPQEGQAKLIIGRTPGGRRTTRPLRRGEAGERELVRALVPGPRNGNKSPLIGKNRWESHKWQTVPARQFGWCQRLGHSRQPCSALQRKDVPMKVKCCRP